jgi:hypothetical protein
MSNIDSLFFDGGNSSVDFTVMGRTIPPSKMRSQWRKGDRSHFAMLWINQIEKEVFDERDAV